MSSDGLVAGSASAQPGAAAAAADPAVPGLSRSTYLGWALGSFTTAVFINSTGLLHMRFMTDSLGMGAALAGTLLAVSKVYDGLTDPLMGVISDRTRSRWGRRRPYLLLGAVMCALAMVGMFNVPAFDSSAALTAWMAAVLIFFATAYTVYRIPYLALGADLTRSFDARSRLMSFNVYGSSAGSLVATTAAPFLLAVGGGGRDAHALVSLVLGALILVAGLASFRLTAEAREPPPTETRQYTFREKLVALGQNAPFVSLIVAKIALFIGISLHISATAYFVRHVLQLSDFSLGGVFLARTLATVASQPVWMRLARRLGRRNALLLAIALDMLMLSGWWAMPAEGAARWLLALGLLQGLVSGGVFLNIQCMLPDTMDYDAQRFGMRREGLFAGIFVMVEKFTAAIASAGFGIYIGAMGYVAAANAGTVQPESALLAIRTSASLLPIGCMLAAMLALLFYRLPRTES